MNIGINEFQEIKFFDKLELKVIDDFETNALVVANFKNENNNVIELRLDIIDNDYIIYSNQKDKLFYIKEALSALYYQQYGQVLNWNISAEASKLI